MGEAALSAKQGELLKTLKTLYTQQKDMYENGTLTVADRIVSIHSPFVKPIVQGKTNAPVEFGAKLAIRMVDGYATVEHLSWDAFNEMTTLIGSDIGSGKAFIRKEFWQTRSTERETYYYSARRMG